LFHQDQPLIEYHRKTGAGWLLTEIEGMDAVLSVDTLELQLPLNELYEGVDWLPAEEE
jgi:hypothetical protein